MTDARILQDDRWGAVIDYPTNNIIEIRWYDTTVELDRQSFNNWLSMFAGHVESTRRQGILVDSTSFRMARHEMDSDWRDANIIPRYNSAGVLRFAIHMPEGMPAIGAEPAPEGPANFPTGYFGARQAALAWLGS
jgi:hypothetical protein